VADQSADEEDTQAVPGAARPAAHAHTARRHPHMMSVEDARSTLRQCLQPLPARRAHLADNIGATLAEPLCTSTALPPVDVSAMDGYAVRGNGPWILRPDIQVAGRLHQCVGR
jgi:hypothetical protein